MSNNEFIVDLIEVLKNLDQQLLEMSGSLEQHQQIRAEITRKLEVAMQQQEYMENGRVAGD